MTTAVQIGKHTAHIEGNLLFFRIIENLSLDELHTYLKIAENIEAEHGACYIIDDISEFSHASPEVRRLIIDWFAAHHCPGVALFGGSLAARTLALLVITAMKMLGKQGTPIVFVKKEQEARDWINTQRHKHPPPS